MATGWPMKVTYANGDVYSASDVNDITGTINLLGASVAYAAGKNKIINGDFRFNQRAFTSTTTSNTYGFDRFGLNASDGTVTYSAQTFTPGAAPVAGYEAKNFAQIVTTGQTLTTAVASLFQKIEDVRTFAGQTITFSFYAKANTGTPNINAILSQNFGSGGSPSATVITSGTAQTITTSWARYSFTIAVPSISGKTIGTTENTSFLNANIFVSSGSAGTAPTVGIQSNTFQIWGVQLEAGSTATAFQTATGTIQGELAACQRYYQLLASGASGGICSAYSYSANGVQGLRPLAVEMRTTPTLSVIAGTNYYNYTIASATSFNTFILDGSTTNKVAVIYINTLSGLTTGQSGQFNVANASAFVAVQAEL